MYCCFVCLFTDGLKTNVVSVDEIAVQMSSFMETGLIISQKDIHLQSGKMYHISRGSLYINVDVQMSSLTETSFIILSQKDIHLKMYHISRSRSKFYKFCSM